MGVKVWRAICEVGYQAYANNDKKVAVKEWFKFFLNFLEEVMPPHSSRGMFAFKKMIIVLMVRPYGLFGTKEVVRV